MQVTVSQRGSSTGASSQYPELAHTSQTPSQRSLQHTLSPPAVSEQKPEPHSSSVLQTSPSVALFGITQSPAPSQTPAPPAQDVADGRSCDSHGAAAAHWPIASQLRS